MVRRVVKVHQELVPHAAVIAYILGHDGVEQPELVLRPAGGHVKPLFGGWACEGSETQLAPVARCYNHAEEDHVPFITLKCVRIAADNPSPLDLFGANAIQQQSFNQLCLSFAQQGDDTDCFALIHRIVAASSDSFNNGGSFAIVAGALRATLPPSRSDVPGQEWRQPRGRMLAEGN
jgi:hypothetical protein